jgi:clan AA aspartic protease
LCVTARANAWLLTNAAAGLGFRRTTHKLDAHTTDTIAERECLARFCNFFCTPSTWGRLTTGPAGGKLSVRNLPTSDDWTEGEAIMGVTRVTATVRNPAQPDCCWEGLCRVNAGARDCLVPRNCLREIGLFPKGMRTYEAADGSEKKVEITVAQVEFLGEIVGATVIFGDDDAEPILGVTALESIGIEVDPRTHELTRRPAVRLK